MVYRWCRSGGREVARDVWMQRMRLLSSQRKRHTYIHTYNIRTYVYMSYRQKGSALRFYVGWTFYSLFDQSPVKRSRNTKSEAICHIHPYAMFSHNEKDFRNRPVYTSRCFRDYIFVFFLVIHLGYYASWLHRAYARLKDETHNLFSSFISGKSRVYKQTKSEA